MDKIDLLRMTEEWLNIEIDQTSMISSQIDKFQKEHGYSYKGIGRAIFYHFVELKKPFLPQFGIGIVPYVFKDAEQFFIRKSAEENKLKEQGKILRESMLMERSKIKANPKHERRGINLIKFEDL